MKRINTLLSQLRRMTVSTAATAILASVLFPLISLQAPAFATSGTTGDFAWGSNGTSVTITGCATTCPASLTIPATINGLPVTKIGIRAFSYDGLTSVTFAAGSNLTEIVGTAFAGENFTSIALPASLRAIDNGAFSGEADLTSVTFATGSQLTLIDQFAFSYDPVLSSIALPASLQTVGGYAFTQDSLLASVTFATGSQLTSIGAYAFNQDVVLASILLPALLQSIGDYAFADDPLTSVTLPSALTSIGNYAFAFDNFSSAPHVPSGVTLGNMAFATSGTTGDFTWESDGSTMTITGCASTCPGALTIPATINGLPVTKIGNRAFVYAGLTSVTFAPGSHVTEIVDFAFLGENFTTITLPASLQTVDNGVFDNENQLTSVTFAAGSQLANVGQYGFAYDPILASLSFPATVQSVASGAFYQDPLLSSVTFAAGSQLTTIGSYAFYQDSVLASITLPASLQSIGDYAFAYDPLTSVTLPSALTSIGNYAFAFDNFSSAPHVPSGVTLGNMAFATSGTTGDFTWESDGTVMTITGCATTCPGALTIPATINGLPVTKIGSRAFLNAGLTSVTFAPGSHVTEIVDFAFLGENFTTINLPASLQKVDNDVFVLDNQLTSVSFAAGSQLTTLGDFAFSSDPLLTTIALPSGLLSIGAETFNSDPALPSISLPTSLVSIGSIAFDPAITSSWTCSLSFSLQGGTPTGSNPSCPGYGQVIFLPAAPTKSGATFLGWELGTITYQPGDSFTIGGQSVTYASGGHVSDTFTALWQGSGPAPAPTYLPQSSLGTPVSVAASPSQPSSVALNAGSVSATVVVPAGALPTGTTVSAFPVTTSSAVQVPSGQTYVTSVVVTWQAPDGTSPNATQPISLTIHDSSIHSGDHIYQIINSVSTLLGTATQDGVAQITFSVDPVLTVTRTATAQAPAIIYAKPTAPSNVTAALNSGTAVVTFTPGSNGNLATSNEVDLYINGVNEGAVCTVMLSNTCTVSNLAPNVTDTFQVVASNSLGSATSPLSNAVSYTVAPPAPVTAPTSSKTTTVYVCVLGKLTAKPTSAHKCPVHYKLVVKKTAA